MDHQVWPPPTDDEAAAIAVAVELLWPQPVALVQPDHNRNLTWRFSGRWWHRAAARSARPWG